MKYCQTFLAILLFSLNATHATEKIMLISVPVASLRTKPEAFNPQKPDDRPFLTSFFGKNAETALQQPPALRDPVLDTQMLYGERVKCLSAENGWLSVELLDQIDINTEGLKVPIKGYLQEHEAIPDTLNLPAQFVFKNLWVTVCSKPDVATACMRLPLGVALPGKRINDEWICVTLVTGQQGFVKTTDCYEYATNPTTNENILRKRILDIATLFKGMPYGWGCRCPLDSTGTHNQTSVDCSALINLAYRASGFDTLIRNSRSQFNVCKKLESGADLKPGDCIFLARTSNPARVIHIMLYAGNNHTIDAFRPGTPVLNVDASQRFGCTLEKVKAGEHVGEYVFYFGTFFGQSERSNR